MVTLVTFAVAWDASPEPAWPLMTEANTCPFCTRLIRLVTGVLALKKAVQFAAISWAATPPAGAADDGAELAGAAELDDGLAAGLLLPLLVLLLLQAARAKPAAHTRRINGDL